MLRVLSSGERGSPPHMRGKVAPETVNGGHSGITPAHAGKRRRNTPRSPCSRDHPRTCGEKDFSAGGKDCIQGSPPHMRGKVAIAYKYALFQGITPAHAGKRKTWNWTKRQWRDHPRTCGEKQSQFRSLCASMGSPPHMRGKAHRRPGTAVRRGITPAHAGKSH